MSDTLALSILTLSAVLILIAISGGRFKIFGAEIKGTVGRISRVIAGFAGFLILVVLLIFYIFPKLPDGLFSNLGGEEYPKPIATNPIDGATDVDSSLSEITVTFNKPMASSWSWCSEGKDSYPELTRKPYFINNDTTCVLPVKLKPGKSYIIWINNERFKNFKDKNENAVEPYKLVFTTRQE